MRLWSRQAKQYEQEGLAAQAGAVPFAGVGRGNGDWHGEVIPCSLVLRLCSLFQEC